MLIVVQHFVKRIAPVAIVAATILLTSLGMAGCTRASLPESSISTTIILAQDSTQFIEPVYHSARTRTYIRYKMQDSNVPTFFDPVNQITVPMPNGGASYTELSNGNLVFYNDPRDPSLASEESLHLYVVSPIEGSVEHAIVTRLQLSEIKAADQDVLFFQGFIRLNPAFFMYGGQLFQITTEGVYPGPRTDYYQNKIGNVPFIWVDQPGADSSTRYYPLTCDPRTLEFLLDSPALSPGAQVPLFYPDKDYLQCLQARYTKVFSNAYTGHYVFMTDNPIVPQDILPVRISGNKIKEQIEELFREQIQQVPITSGHLLQEPTSQLSPYDQRYRVEIKEEEVPHKIGEYFRYQTLSLSVNNDVQGSLHRYRITLLGFSQTALFFLSEHGIERLDFLEN